MSEVPKLDEFLFPGDLKNLDEKCRDCSSREVVYHISVPAPNFPEGSYCYKCLLNHCRLSHRIPVPIEWQLQSRLEVDLGIARAVKYFMGTRAINF